MVLFLTNNLHLNHLIKNPSPKIAKKALFCYSEIYIVSVTCEKIQYFVTVEKKQFYSHLICIEFTACDEIKLESFYS